MGAFDSWTNIIAYFLGAIGSLSKLFMKSTTTLFNFPTIKVNTYTDDGKKLEFNNIGTKVPQLAVLTKRPSVMSVSSTASSGLKGRQTGRTVSVNSMMRSEIC
jgi:hypothetical protein